QCGHAEPRLPGCRRRRGRGDLRLSRHGAISRRSCRQARCAGGAGGRPDLCGGLHQPQHCRRCGVDPFQPAPAASQIGMMMSLRRIPVTAWIGIILTTLFVASAILAPWIAPYSPSAIVGGVWEPASDRFLLGTDNLGRDLLSRMIHGGRTTLAIAALATALSFSLGSIPR